MSNIITLQATGLKILEGVGCCEDKPGMKEAAELEGDVG